MDELQKLEKYFSPFKPHSRAAYKMAKAVDQFNLNLTNKICADFGANAGGFSAVMLNCGAAKVYAVETGYGLLEWNLRQSDKIICMERTNAMRVKLAEVVDFISIDTSWTKQKNILPNAISNLKPDGLILTLVKPHYELDDHKFLKHGAASDDILDNILNKVRLDIQNLNLRIIKETESPIAGKSAKNREFLWLLSMK